MVVDVLVIVLGGLGALYIGAVSEATPTSRLGRLKIPEGATALNIICGACFGLPAISANDLADGLPAAWRVMWLFVAAIGMGLLVVVPLWVTRLHQGRTILRGRIRAADTQP